MRKNRFPCYLQGMTGERITVPDFSDASRRTVFCC